MELSLRDIKELLWESERVNPFGRWMGKKVFIRTVTHHYTGIVTELIGENFAILEKAAWIADDGRFTDSVASGNFDEVEMFKYSIGLNIGSVIDITELDAIPGTQK